MVSRYDGQPKGVVDIQLGGESQEKKLDCDDRAAGGDVGREESDLLEPSCTRARGPKECERSLLQNKVGEMVSDLEAMGRINLNLRCELALQKSLLEVVKCAPKEVPKKVSLQALEDLQRFLDQSSETNKHKQDEKLDPSNATIGILALKKAFVESDNRRLYRNLGACEGELKRIERERRSSKPLDRNDSRTEMDRICDEMDRLYAESRQRTVVLEQTITSKSCSVQLLKEFFAGYDEEKEKSFEELYPGWKTELKEVIALRVRIEENSSPVLKKISDLERERSQLQDTISSVTEELNRASAALEESEKEAASYREQFVQKAEIAEEVLSLRDRVKTLEGQLTAALEKKALMSSSLATPSSPDDAYFSLSSPRAASSPLNESGDTSLKNVSNAMSVSSGDITMFDEQNRSKMELFQAKESCMKYQEMSVDLKRDNEELKKELNKLRTQSLLAGLSFTAVVVLVFGVFLGMALDSMYHSLNY